jgi:putative ABC transport system permease protein
MRAVRLLNLRRLRRQPLRALIAVVAVAAGVSLAVSVVIVQQSIHAAIGDFARAVAGPTPLRVIGPAVRGGLDESVVPRIEATPGVGAAVPMVQAVAMAQDNVGLELPIVVFGVDCRVQQLLGPLGCDPAALAAASDAAPPLVSKGLRQRLGTGATVRTDLGRSRLDGAVAVEGLDRLNRGRVVVYPLPVAQRLFVRPHRLDVVYVQPAPGTPVAELKGRLQQRVGVHNAVLDATDPPPQAAVVEQIFIPLLGLTSLFALGVGAVLVYNTIALSLEERRRPLAVVAALGGSPRRIMGGTLLEAAVLGVAGGALGTAGGAVVAGPITKSLSDFTQKGLGLPIGVSVSRGVIALGMALGVAVSVAASILPTRRAMRVDIAAELSNRELRAEAAPGVRWRRAAISLAVGAFGIFMCWVAQRGGALQPWQAAAGPVAFVIATVGLMIGVAALTPAVIGMAARLLRRPTAPVRLGLANLVREPGRTGIMSVAVGSAVGIAFLLASFTSSVHAGITANIQRGDSNWVWASTLDPNNTVNIDSKVPPSLVEQLRAFPGVQDVQRVLGLITGVRAGEQIGIDGFGDERPDFGMLEGTNDGRRFDAGEVVIGPGLARATGVRPGGRVVIDTPTGRTSVKVQGIWQDGDFGGRNIAMPIEELERLYGPQPTDTVFIRPARGVTPTELAGRLRAARLDPSLRVHTPRSLIDTAAKDIGNQLSSFWAIQRALLIVAFVAVMSTLLLVGVQRRRELGLLAAVGMQPGELARMVVAEAGTVGLTGIALGVLTGAFLSLGMIWLTVVIVGFQDPLQLDVGSVPGAAVVGLVVVLAAAAWPAWRTSRLEVVEALQYE